MAGESERIDNAADRVLGSPLQNLSRAAAFVIGIFVLSTTGFVSAGWSLSDAAYMVILTIFSVGYGEVHPIDTAWLRTLIMGTIVLGCTGMIFFTGALVQVFAHYQIRNILGMNRMQSQIDRLTDHAIICGYGRIGKQLALELQRAKAPYIILDRNPTKLAEAETYGHLTHQGDATDETTLHAVGIERARVLATVLPDDALNVFITLSARNLNPNLEIIARGEYPSTEGKLIHAGADKVVLPTHIGAERIAELILYPTTERFLGETPQVRDLKRELHEFGLEIEAVTIPENAALAGATVGEAERRGDGAFFLVQIDRPNGQSYVHPSEDVKIEAGDTVVLVLRGTRVTAGSVFTESRQAFKLGQTYR